MKKTDDLCYNDDGGKVKSVYIHIPFCESICSYCDFCKVLYHKSWIKKYLTCLQKEIQKRYKGELIKTLYIGGGTPSALDMEDLRTLLEILCVFKKDDNLEFSFECNIENITKEKLWLLKEYGVNRLSVGVQTIHESYLNFLNRHHTSDMVRSKIHEMKEIGFSNINIDLMYAFPKESVKEVLEDVDFFLSLDVPHVSTYSLIIEPHTILGIQKIHNIDSDTDAKMYEVIKERLTEAGYIHYETSNFAKRGYESKHNLTYWNNEEYYGFGLGASGYIQNIRYENTRSLTNYQNGYYIAEQHELSKREQEENEMILGLRKMNGVSKSSFYKKYHEHIEDVFEIDELIKKGMLKLNGDYLYIPNEYQYVANSILIYFIGD